MNVRNIATALAVAVALCASRQTGTSAEPLKIGLIAPLTGAAAPWGMAMAEGAKILFAAEYRKAIGQEPNEVLAPYADGVNVLIHSVRMSGAVNDTSKFEAGFGKALPMDSIQGETMTIGGKEKYGVDHQVSVAWRQTVGTSLKCHHARNVQVIPPVSEHTLRNSIAQANAGRGLDGQGVGSSLPARAALEAVVLTWLLDQPASRDSCDPGCGFPTRWNPFAATVWHSPDPITQLRGDALASCGPVHLTEELSMIRDIA